MRVSSASDRSPSTSHSPSPRRAGRIGTSRDSELCQTIDIPIINHQQIDSLNSIRLGRGTYGHVEKARFRRTPSTEYGTVAIKFANDTIHRSTLIREAKIMHQLQSHPHVIKIFGIYECLQNGTGVVMEYMDCKSMAELIANHNIDYTIDHAASWLYQLSSAVDFFHSHQQVHRDLKLQNMLLSNRYRTMKLCDFGTFTSMHDSMTSNRGTPITMAPEIFRGEQYNTKCDIYSIGIIMWQILARREPYTKSMDPNVLLWNVASSGKRPPELACSYILSGFYKRCWDSDPDVRPTSKETLEYFTLLRDEHPHGNDPLTDIHTKEAVNTPQPHFSSSRSSHLSNPSSSQLNPHRTHRRAGSDQAATIRLVLPEPVATTSQSQNDPMTSSEGGAMRGTRSKSVAGHLSNIASVSNAAAEFAKRVADPRNSQPRRIAPPPPRRPSSAEDDHAWLNKLESSMHPPAPNLQDGESLTMFNEHTAQCYQLHQIQEAQREKMIAKHGSQITISELEHKKKIVEHIAALRAQLAEAERREHEHF